MERMSFGERRCGNLEQLTRFPLKLCWHLPCTCITFPPQEHRVPHLAISKFMIRSVWNTASVIDTLGILSFIVLGGIHIYRNIHKLKRYILTRGGFCKSHSAQLKKLLKVWYEITNVDLPISVIAWRCHILTIINTNLRFVRACMRTYKWEVPFDPS